MPVQNLNYFQNKVLGFTVVNAKQCWPVPNDVVDAENLLFGRHNFDGVGHQTKIVEPVEAGFYRLLPEFRLFYALKQALALRRIAWCHFF